MAITSLITLLTNTLLDIIKSLPLLYNSHATFGSAEKYWGAQTWELYNNGNDLIIELNYVRQFFTKTFGLQKSNEYFKIFNNLNKQDMMILAMAFPNILGLLILSGEVKIDLKEYLNKVKNGMIKKIK